MTSMSSLLSPKLHLQMSSAPQNLAPETEVPDVVTKIVRGNSCFEISRISKCSECNVIFKSSNIVEEFVLNLQEKKSIRESFEIFFENEVFENFNCIFCMKTVSASKKWLLLSTPECLHLMLNHHSYHKYNIRDIEINQNLILKCNADGRACFWKYEFRSVIDNVGRRYSIEHCIRTEHFGEVIYILNDSKIDKEYHHTDRNLCTLYYDRIEEVLIDESSKGIPTVEIHDSDSDSNCEFLINETDTQNVSYNDHESIEPNTKAVERKTTKPVSNIVERPRRAAVANRQFVDSAVWDNNADSSTSSVQISEPPKSKSKSRNQSASKSMEDQDVVPNTNSKCTSSNRQKTAAKSMKDRDVPKTNLKGTSSNRPKSAAKSMKDRDVPKTNLKGTSSNRPKSAAKSMKDRDVPKTNLKGTSPNRQKTKIVKESAPTGSKLKNFVRFRFQIDCTAAEDVDVDQLVIFLKKNMKVDGVKNNLLDSISIDKRNSNVNILSKVILKKKYLKLLTKKHLKKQKLDKYGVISKNKRAYKIIIK